LLDSVPAFTDVVMRETLFGLLRVVTAIGGAGRYAAVALSLVSTSLVSAGAQMPGAPVLQNAWATPGIVGALNIAGGSNGQAYAAAASWASGTGRFQLSGGFGFRSVTGAGSRGVYGARLAMPLGGNSASNLGFALFAGVGGGAGGTTTASDSAASTTQVPVGAAIGWRRALGATHGISLYASPSYVFLSGGRKSSGLVRAAVAADVGITSSVGLTAGIEFGQNRSSSSGATRGTLYGFGLAYALGRR
jgi:hypothetical protein